MKANGDIRNLLEMAVDQKASDLHLTSGVPPFLRINGDIVPIEGYPPLRPAILESMAEQIAETRHMNALNTDGEVDFSYGLVGIGRFRCTLFRQRGSLTLAIRVINSRVPSLDELGLPDVIYDLCRKKDGLILVTGPTGSGKSTTLAGMIDVINRERRGIIVTLEDPVEYLHSHNKCLINQREVGSDTQSFANGLRSALRADPDVILVGEMRDLETIATAITAAETGHLVLSTLHTRGAAKTVDRIIDSFPEGTQHQIRVQLSTVLEAVISQQLLPRLDGRGMVPAVEVMLGTPAIRNMIREGKTHQIPAMIETGLRFGMQPLKHSLETLVQKGLVDQVEAGL